MSGRPCAVRLPGGTSHTGQGSVEYALRRWLSQVGERTPWRLTIATYRSSGASALPAGQATSRSAPISTVRRLFLTIQVIPDSAGVCGLVPFPLVHEDRAAGIVAEYFVSHVQ